MLQKQLHHIGAQRSESLEDQIRVFIFSSGGIKRLEEFKRRTLRSRYLHDEVTFSVFAEAEIVRQEIGAHMANALRPGQSLEPSRQSLPGTTAEEKRMGFTQGQEMRETGKFQCGAPTRMKGLGSRLAYTQKSRGQNLPRRPLSNASWRPRVAIATIPAWETICGGWGAQIRSAPVSDTGGPGARPGEAANRRRATKDKHLTTQIAEAVCRHLMSDILNKTTVLVLNRNWQAINIRTPQEAFCMMATNVATGLDIEFDETAETGSINAPHSVPRVSGLRPVPWEEWITLPIRPQDHAVRTTHRKIRVPTVIVAVNFARVPKKRPKLSARNIRERDGNRCQYTGRLLHPNEGSLDHVVPRSRGGRDTWENLVWSAKEVNQRKADRLPHEAGLRLLKVPRAPRELPVTALLRNTHGLTDWRLFLNE